ncbi:DoxX family membrane protein [Cupriavidus gilardii]|jgi:hypothetical protein|uniref:DoxX family protein n=7 Tax=Burkholderiaceae TaxID=119060 RepID=A0A375CK70_9BURK|nr:hypothetical protein OR214_04672 [Ralstonia pickettii OR214]KAA6115910.1 DoxX family membrane protein [Cupriavidus cauae]KAB0595248.1 DoxX family membrane protein [Cupriavidus gilardii]MBA9966246.1 DoxX family membrane protein [Ralstonia pickettii]MBL4779930.1 DoxX family membrane protein [Ralstonia sp.]MWL92170.1 DoxX family membrane protein [Cupriavidus sp. SW-Y-13]NOV26700.1 DoxX family membrane protein [Cupriavidus necator]NSX13951.1 DoxX family membrane protein [Cupriavidus taiwanens
MSRNCRAVRAEKKPTFWNSAIAKLANWNAALDLFREDYRVPLVPSESAACLAVSIELTAPALLLLGLATRAVAMRQGNARCRYGPSSANVASTKARNCVRSVLA